MLRGRSPILLPYRKPRWCLYPYVVGGELRQNQKNCVRKIPRMAFSLVSDDLPQIMR